MRCESEFVSDLEVRADEALRTTQAIGKSLTRELDRLARRTKQKTVRRSPVTTLRPSQPPAAASEAIAHSIATQERTRKPNARKKTRDSLS